MSSRVRSEAPADLVQRAREAQAQGNDGETDALFARLLNLRPDHAEAANWLGSRALKRGDPATAAELFARATATDDRAPQLWLNLATARRAMDDVEGERNALLRALDIDQRFLPGLVRLAELHERAGEAGAAVQRWSAVLQLAATGPPPPALVPILERARAYVAAQTAAFGDAIDAGLASVRSTLSLAGRRRIDACIDASLGRRRIYHNECHGLHYPFLPADEFFDRAHFPWLTELEARWPAIRREAETLLADGAPLEPYVVRPAGSPPSKWSALDNSPDWSVFYLWRYGERIDAACDRCPETAAAMARVPLAQMPRRAPTVFFSILRPGTRLPAHSGVSNTRAICHLPLIVPDGCGFRVGGETRSWREGEAFVFDDTIEHEAWNDSSAPRVVLILDVWNPHIPADERTALAQYFEVVDASELNPDRFAQVSD